MKMKNDMVRHQISILGEIQMQNPTEVININGIMDQIQRENSDKSGSNNTM